MARRILEPEPHRPSYTPTVKTPRVADANATLQSWGATASTVASAP
jgi:hypothetical protein